MGFIFGFLLFACLVGFCFSIALKSEIKNHPNKFISQLVKPWMFALVGFWVFVGLIACTQDEKLVDPVFVTDQSGVESVAATNVMIRHTMFKPVANKTYSSITGIDKPFTLAEKPAISILTSSFDDDGEEVAVNITLRKESIAPDVIFRAQKVFDPENKVISANIVYEDKRYNHDLYDDYQDIFFELIITKIENGIVYCNYSGKLYVSLSDRSSITVNGKLMFKL